eukprot:CAMPEP_0183790740 /NCGR_PEP_ID=MMETSP0803_2-20130417/1314_1 /TAXON_ID=195967 /ORGANISM="Crustomastix stigmata, Strain CCMP3273" /LENGTH=461 /DNA_ID=CAMNT_0026035001 /DNA_START=134 /DNA_END=1519 /DNA_ORIENTATION=-
MEEIRRHCTPESCWTVVNGFVFDISSYISEHPGGELILHSVGKDATFEFMSHHSLQTFNMIKKDSKICIGIVTRRCCESTTNSAGQNQSAEEGDFKFEAEYFRLQKEIYGRIGKRRLTNPLEAEVKSLTGILLFILVLVNAAIHQSFLLAFLVGNFRLVLNGIHHSHYHGQLRLSKLLSKFYVCFVRSVELEFMRNAYFAYPPIHLEKFRTARQRAYVKMFSSFANTNVAHSHAYHHAHTNTTMPLDPEFLHMFPMHEYLKNSHALLKPIYYAVRSFKTAFLNAYIACRLTVMVFQEIGICTESIGNLCSTIVSVLFNPVCPIIFMCTTSEHYKGLCMVCCATLGYLTSYVPVLWGGHARNTADYTDSHQMHLENSWMLQQISGSYNVLLPFSFLQKHLCFDFAWMIEHHLFPHASTTCWGACIQKETKAICSKYNVDYKVQGLLQVFHRMFWQWDMTKKV